MTQIKMDTMDKQESLHFRDQLRAARAVALRDAEAFQEIIFVLERLGIYLCKHMKGLSTYQEAITDLAMQSPMAVDIPSGLPDLHRQFKVKYEIVREARNAALHEGALARHLTKTAVELSLVLEEAIMNKFRQVGDFMVRHPVCAHLWQPLSFIRQTMLENSFSYLPVSVQDQEKPTWRLVSDFQVARYLRKDGKVSRERLVEKLEKAVKLEGIELLTAVISEPTETIETALQKSKGLPILVFSSENEDIVGILTPFDLL